MLEEGDNSSEFSGDKDDGYFNIHKIDSVSDDSLSDDEVAERMELTCDDFDDFVTTCDDVDFETVKDYADCDIPCTNDGEFKYEISEDTVSNQLHISGHIMFNQCGSLLTRKQHELKGSSKHKHF
eukprot:11058735-Ditylum_brightwellii.AAC.1